MMRAETQFMASYSTPGNSDTRQTELLLERAYRNIYGTSLPQDESWLNPLLYAARQLVRDPRAQNLSSRNLVSVIEDMIRISDEHNERARKHLAQASNPVYLRETALDKALEEVKYQEALTEILPGERSTNLSDTRMQAANKARMTSAEMMELAYQQLALTPKK